MQNKPMKTLTINGEVYEVTDETARNSGGSGSGLSNEAKQALLACFQHVAWTSADGQDYYDALEAALYPPADLVSISAVFDQTGVTIYSTDSLEDLRQYLTVTALYDNTITEVITAYTLSGTLTVGTSTVTVSYGGKTDEFSVTVTAPEYPKTITATSGGVGFSNTNNTAPTYLESWTNKARVHLCGDNMLGYPIELGKSYKITISNYAAQMIGIKTLSEAARENVINSQNIVNGQYSDSGWQSMTSGVYTHTPTKIAGSGDDPVFMWITFKKDSSGTSWTGDIEDVEMFPITIEEI